MPKLNWKSPEIIARVKALCLVGSSGRHLRASDYLYHHTADENVLAILREGLRSEMFHDSVDESQAELYRDESVIWFTDCPTEFRDADRPAQFRARLGDLVACAGEPVDPGQQGEGKHFFFSVPSTPRAPRTLTIPPAVLELMPPIAGE